MVEVIGLSLSGRRTKALAVIAVLAAFVIAGLVQPKTGQAREPLLMDGKQTLFERVLTRPGAELADAAGGSGEQVEAFSRYYVYSTEDAGGATWLEVGPDTKGQTTFWIDKEKTIPWRQQIALSISNPAGRSPLYFFKERSTLEEVYGDFEPKVKFEEIEAILEKNGQDDRVVAKEPSVAVDISEEFYLLPILSAEEVLSGAGPNVRFLEVASVTKQDPSSNQGGTSNSMSLVLRSFQAAVVFVIDSTISMGPYIERTREVVQQVYETIEERGLNEKVKFGLVAYRSNIDVAPGLEYITKEYANPGDVTGGDDFLKKIESLQPAPVSSAAFDEDSFAGVMTALDGINWADFGGRYVVLITDAGALAPEDELASIELGEAEIRQEAAHRGIALYTLHLKTPAGQKNHASAQAQYEGLSHNNVIGQPLYFDIEAGSVDAFGTVVDDLARQIADQVDAAYKGEAVAGSAVTADDSFGSSSGQTPQDNSLSPGQQKLKQATALLGHAMQLAYIGEQTGVQAPDVIQAWVADRDAKNLKKPMTEVRVLLTKNQLSDLKDIVSVVLDSAKAGVINPDEMFDQLRSAAVTMGRDPNDISKSRSTQLVELGLFGEYLEGLPPYPTKVLSLNQDAWERMGGADQDALVRDLDRKLRYYEHINSDTDRWVRLAEGADPSEDVFPVPLDLLP